MSVYRLNDFGNRPTARQANRRRGFTAIEMVAVASIMVILSLLLVMNVSKRVESARATAVKDEMQEIGKIEQLAYAENAEHYFMLQDLDNTDSYTSNTAAFNGTGIPISFYTGATPVLFTYPPADPRRAALSSSWQGPYTQFRRYATMAILGGTHPELFNNNNGPIFAVVPATGAPFAPNDKYPIDPWGSPYIFEPRGNQGFRIWSLGPDGMPGLVPPSAVLQGSNFYTWTGPTGPLDPRLGETGSDDVYLDF